MRIIYRDAGEKMGLLSSFRDLFKGNDRKRENKGKKPKEPPSVSARSAEREDLSEYQSQKGESEEVSENTVSASEDTSVSVQKVEKDQENLQRIDEREILWEMNKKIDELLEIKELYNDMLDWMVEISKKEEIEGDRNQSRDVSKESSKESNLSPRLRQVLEIVREKGELNASKLSEELDLSKNRCSELLNSLFKANYLSKKRVGRKVYYRAKSNSMDIGV